MSTVDGGAENDFNAFPAGIEGPGPETRRLQKQWQKIWVGQVREPRAMIAEARGYLQSHAAEIEELKSRHRIPQVWPEVELSHASPFLEEAARCQEELEHTYAETGRYPILWPGIEFMDRLEAKAYWVHHAAEFGLEAGWFEYIEYCRMVKAWCCEKGRIQYHRRHLDYALSSLSGALDNTINLAAASKYCGVPIKDLRSQIARRRLKAKVDANKNTVVSFRDFFNAGITQ
jgi:hypothetical protein